MVMSAVIRLSTELPLLSHGYTLQLQPLKNPLKALITAVSHSPNRLMETNQAGDVLAHDEPSGARGGAEPVNRGGVQPTQKYRRLAAWRRLDPGVVIVSFHFDAL